MSELIKIEHGPKVWSRVNAWAITKGFKFKGEHTFQSIICSTKREGGYLIIPSTHEDSEYKLSQIGEDLQNEIDGKIDEVGYRYVAVADTNYYHCNESKMWSKFSERGIFSLWDIEKGPLKYSEQKKERKYPPIVVLFRVYRLDDTQVPEVHESDRGGSFPTFYIKPSNPVIRDDKFIELKKRIEQILFETNGFLCQPNEVMDTTFDSFIREEEVKKHISSLPQYNKEILSKFNEEMAAREKDENKKIADSLLKCLGDKDTLKWYLNNKKMLKKETEEFEELKEIPLNRLVYIIKRIEEYLDKK